MKLSKTKEDLIIVIGSFIYAASVNLFAVPAGIYSGGIVGTAQLIRTLIINTTGFNPNYDFAGIINFCLNIPLFLLAYKSLSKRFTYTTLLSIIIQTITMTLVKVPSSPFVEDVIAQLVVAGVTTGVGCGFVLLMKSSSGGMDILGMWMGQKRMGISVGAISVFYNAALYALCAFLFNFQTAIYSLIYVFIFGVAMDKVHYQNIDVQVMVFTKHPDEIKEIIVKEYVRGITYWSGKGAYTNEDTEVFITICSKYEVPKMRKMIREHDPKAFVITTENINVKGNVEKRLV